MRRCPKLALVSAVVVEKQLAVAGGIAPSKRINATYTSDLESSAESQAGRASNGAPRQLGNQLRRWTRCSAPSRYAGHGLRRVGQRVVVVRSYSLQGKERSGQQKDEDVKVEALEEVSDVYNPFP